MLQPPREYSSTTKIGDGAYGSISTVFDEEGRHYAMKTFEVNESDGSLDQTTVREVSMMRLLLRQNAHKNILLVHDIVVPSLEVCMVMPKFGCNLESLIKGKVLKRKQKTVIAHQLLSALAYLNDNGIMHRDVKPDNIMMTEKMEPVLIDFSLAKFVDQGLVSAKSSKTNGQHTGDCGTATFMAPEVYEKKPYGIKADSYSAGVVLLELFMDKSLKADKDKEALALVQKLTQSMADKPVPNMLRALLATDPAKRMTCREALMQCKLFEKAKLTPPKVRKINFLHVLSANHRVRHAGASGFDKKKKKKKKKKKAKKSDSSSSSPSSAKLIAPYEFADDIRKMFNRLDCVNPATITAACRYGALTGCMPENCLLVAMKMYEPECYDLAEEDMDELFGDSTEEEFSLESFIDDETFILETMDFCLYVFQEPVQAPAKKNIGKVADAKKTAIKNDDTVLTDVINKTVS